MAYPLMLTFTVGIVLRLWLFGLPISEWLAEKNEISTPLTSWKRVTEGLALHKVGVSPYSGDIFHQMPIMLRVFNYFNNIWGNHIHILFVILDVMTALALERIAKHLGRHLLLHQAMNVKNYSPEASSLVLKADHLRVVRLYVVAAESSTSVFFIALATYMSLYPIMLLVPAALFLAKLDIHGKSESNQKSIYWTSLLQTCLCTGAAVFLLIYTSYLIEGSWDFLQSTFGFILGVPDLTPNVGVFWYFFTEMFEHFRFFFICVFQINAFIYTVPLAIRLKDHPMFMMYILIALMAIFKSYPSYADTALYLAMMPMWSHTLNYLRNSFVVSMMYIVCTVLAPILWHLWIYAGSANANFYFAITLVYSTAQVFLVTDLLFAFLRREYELLEGTKPPIINGKPAQVILD